MTLRSCDQLTSKTVTRNRCRSHTSLMDKHRLYMDFKRGIQLCVFFFTPALVRSLRIKYFFVLLVLLNMTSNGHATQLELSYRVTEELEVGSFVGDVRKNAGLQVTNDVDTVRQFGYQFLTQPPTNFTIDRRSSVISTSGRIDRDTLCPNQEECILQLDVAIKPVQFFQIIKITVEIIDINDNIPTFDDSQISHLMFESAAVGTAFTIPTASDPDSPEFTVISYELDTDAPNFELKVRDKVNGAKEVRLVLIEQLDREFRDHYDMYIVAYDGGIPSKSGSLAVSIAVGDANDNSPGFEESLYEVSTPENTPVNALLIRVSATDPDEGPNGEVVYDFSEQTRRQYGQVFSVGKQSGTIRVQGTLDYEIERVYTLGVIARDLGQDSTPGETTVIVRVEDVNDNPPQIAVNTLLTTGATEALLPENTPPDTFVAHLTVRDPDTDENGRFNCSLNSNFFRLERIYQTEYGIFTAGTLDRESQSFYHLALLCTDFGTPSLDTIQHFNVTITDENDNSPVFLQDTYFAELLENNYIGVFLVRVEASDADTGPNARLRYQVEGEESSLIFVDKDSGEVTAQASLDREKREIYTFWIIARDEGRPARSSSVLLTVRVLDVNDERPQFSVSSYSFGVTEELAAGEEVGTVFADDADGAPYNAFTFSLVDSEGLTEAFYIDPIEGRITTTRSLDREQHAIYRLLAVATDDSTPSMSTTSLITVYIMDINDNNPIFLFPIGYNNTIYVSNRTPLRSVITQVSATDKDIGNNSRLMYEISRGNTGQYFSIDSRSGTIYLERNASSIVNLTFNLLIGVKDHGNPPRAETSELNIVVDSDTFSDPNNGENPELGRYYFMLLIAISAIAGLMITLMLLAIAIALRQHKRRKRRTNTYDCRMDMLKSLSAKETLMDKNGEANSDFPTSKKTKEYMSEYMVDVVPPQSIADDNTRGDNDYNDTELRHKVDKQAYQGPIIFNSGNDKKHSSQEKDWDSTSIHSGDGYNTDSGQGSSETGESAKTAAQTSELLGGMIKSDYGNTAPPYDNLSRDHQPRRSAQRRPSFTSFKGDNNQKQVLSPIHSHGNSRLRNSQNTGVRYNYCDRRPRDPSGYIPLSKLSVDTCNDTFDVK